MAASRKLQLHGHDSIALLLSLFLSFLAFLLCVFANVIHCYRLLCLQARFFCIQEMLALSINQARRRAAPFHCWAPVEFKGSSLYLHPFHAGLAFLFVILNQVFGIRYMAILTLLQQHVCLHKVNFTDTPRLWEMTNLQVVQLLQNILIGVIRT